MTENDNPTELVEQLILTLRQTVANQQIEIIDLRAQLNVAEARLKKLETPKD